MPSSHDYVLAVTEVAAHLALSERAVRAHLRAGRIGGARVGGRWRCRWADLWAVERGPVPRGERAALYRQPLLSKRALAARWSVSERTVERWIARGLPTRSVLGNVRVAPADADAWTAAAFGLGRPS